MKLIFSRSVVDDLIRLREFIAHHNPSAGQRISERLRGAIIELVNHPQIGRPVPDLPGEIRELAFGKYVVRYEVRSPMLYVLRIWHEKEDRCGWEGSLTKLQYSRNGYLVSLLPTSRKLITLVPQKVHKFEKHESRGVPGLSHPGI